MTIDNSCEATTVSEKERHMHRQRVKVKLKHRKMCSVRKKHSQLCEISANCKHEQIGSGISILIKILISYRCI